MILDEEKYEPRLLSAVDYEQGIFNLTFLQPKIVQPKASTDYKVTQLQVKVDEMNVVDKINLHKQTG